MPAALTKRKRKMEELPDEPLHAPPLKRRRISSPGAPENSHVTNAAVRSVEDGRMDLNEVERSLEDGRMDLNKSQRSREDGIRYVNEVKRAFEDDEGSNQRFSDLLKDVRLNRVDYDGVGRRVTELFKDHRRLILGFNRFLPTEHQITLPSPTTEPPEALMERQGIRFRRKVEALGESKFEEFRKILAGYKRKSSTIDQVYKAAETLFAGREDLLAEFRTFLPILEAPMSEITAPQQSDLQQQALPRGKAKFLPQGANARKSESPGESSRRAEISGDSKVNFVKTTNSMEVARKPKDSTIHRKEEARTQHIAVRQIRTDAHDATRSRHLHHYTRSASDQRVDACPDATRPSPNTNMALPPLPPLSSTVELQERMKNLAKCSPNCKACEQKEYSVFDSQAEDPEYYAKGKANRERERQALIANGIVESFNDSDIEP